MYSSVPVACVTVEVLALSPDSTTRCASAPTTPLAYPAAAVEAASRAGAVASSPPCSAGSGAAGAGSRGAGLKGVLTQVAASAPGFSSHTPVGLLALGERAAPREAVARSSPYSLRQATGVALQEVRVGRLIAGTCARARGWEGGGWLSSKRRAWAGLWGSRGMEGCSALLLSWEPSGAAAGSVRPNRESRLSRRLVLCVGLGPALSTFEPAVRREGTRDVKAPAPGLATAKSYLHAVEAVEMYSRVEDAIDAVMPVTVFSAAPPQAKVVPIETELEPELLAAR